MNAIPARGLTLAIAALILAYVTRERTPRIAAAELLIAGVAIGIAASLAYTAGFLVGALS